MLALFGIPIVVGLVVGLFLGGRPGRLAGLSLWALWLVWIAVLIQVCQYYVPAVRRFIEDGIGVPMLVLIYACVGLWLVLNLPRSAPGVRVAIVLLLLGGAINGLAIVANGRMPFSVAAARAAQVPPDKIAAVDLPKNEPASEETRLAWLGDVIPVRPIHKVISFGDVAIMSGIALLVAAGMQPRPAPRTPADASGPDQAGEAAPRRHATRGPDVTEEDERVRG